ncbi:exosome complex RNA-binding protein Csl4 [Methanosarcina mazei]|jgi:exosome complex component CSL4|uniref:Exosome complex component Csl4 n=6 Tax=Methanosarcina mazei TaxID=2209 RepID=A0A0F8IRZ3_METMZ|nr:exosome complex RNA-binding protein Csl4 [Methanosarcina mazei]AAM31575.1 putative RNA-binding protein [Methanosarcina mazei Go1]AGF97289.1 RNA-binding protein, containing S1 domain [Methanosarcina mazei Tuc01]AKB62651.1 exosome complex RNA-binding protein Csl4 [Methanosarcina mazei SarPi]AKB66004.1 exosome complex RNA-binding protein Csl4 [Methanosarcina mazei S-6]AKB71520.1 exosome complex RNA-binding protein Csl4 [Methanosarcina mazei C16]
MIRIRKNKTTRKKLTGPGEGKNGAEKSAPSNEESRDQFKGQQKDQPRTQFKSQPREQSRDQFKGQPRAQYKSQPRDQSRGQFRDQSRDQFKGSPDKKRKFPYSKKGPRDRKETPGFRPPTAEAVVSEEDLEKGGFVLPGELVGTTEEFKSGNGTAVIAGDIYSTATGNVLIDRKARVVSVKPNTITPNILKVGDVVYGRISDVRESGAMVEVAGIEGKENREIVSVRTGDIHVSSVRDSYVKRLADEFRPSDIVRAKVVDVERMRLTTAEDSLGVVKAYCSNCKGELVLEGKKLKCPVCNMTETRKISTEYGKGIR